MTASKIAESTIAVINVLFVVCAIGSFAYAGYYLGAGLHFWTAETPDYFDMATANVGWALLALAWRRDMR